MSTAGFCKGLFVAGLLTIFFGCAAPEHRTRPHILRKTRGVTVPPRPDPGSEGRAVWISPGYFSQEKGRPGKVENLAPTLITIGT